MGLLELEVVQLLVGVGGTHTGCKWLEVPLLLFGRPRVVFLAQFGHVGWGVFGCGCSEDGCGFGFIAEVGREVFVDS